LVGCRPPIRRHRLERSVRSYPVHTSHLLGESIAMSTLINQYVSGRLFLAALAIGSLLTVAPAQAPLHDISLDWGDGLNPVLLGMGLDVSVKGLNPRNTSLV